MTYAAEQRAASMSVHALVASLQKAEWEQQQQREQEEHHPYQEEEKRKKQCEQHGTQEKQEKEKRLAAWRARPLSASLCCVLTRACRVWTRRCTSGSQKLD